MYADAQVSHMPLCICNVELDLTCYCREEQLDGFFSRLHCYKYDASMQACPWAARYNTWLLIKLTPKGIVFLFFFFSAGLPDDVCSTVCQLL